MSDQKSNVVPPNFLCCITQEIMSDPYITTCGHTGDRKALTTWFKDHDKCPHCNEHVSNKYRRKNKELNVQVTDFLKKTPSLRVEQTEEELLLAIKWREDILANEAKQIEEATTSHALLQRFNEMERRNEKLYQQQQRKFAEQQERIRQLERTGQRLKELQQQVEELQSQNDNMRKEIKEKWLMGQDEAKLLAQEIQLLDERAEIVENNGGITKISFVMSGVAFVLAIAGAVIMSPAIPAVAAAAGVGIAMTSTGVTGVATGLCIGYSNYSTNKANKLARENYVQQLKDKQERSQEALKLLNTSRFRVEEKVRDEKQAEEVVANRALPLQADDVDTELSERRASFASPPSTP
jgi:predicted phage tail protein